MIVLLAIDERESSCFVLRNPARLCESLSEVQSACWWQQTRRYHSYSLAGESRNEIPKVGRLARLLKRATWATRERERERRKGRERKGEKSKRKRTAEREDLDKREEFDLVAVHESSLTPAGRPLQPVT